MDKNWLFNVDMVSRLNFIENQFIQVLVTEFTIGRRKGTAGIELSVSFNENSPAISTTRAKTNVHQAIPDFEEKAETYRKELDAVFQGKNGSYGFNDAAFPFRYASGGTLPIVRMDGRDFYCLFYRDIFPIGWNIANGGCCNRDELLKPLRTANRELREELIMVQRAAGIQYIFKGGENSLLSRFRGVKALETWAKIFPELMRKEIKEVEVPAKWYPGPDKANVKIEGFDSAQEDKCFLNINAADFGIEIDQVVKFALPNDVEICDGEQVGNFLINRLVGLFDCVDLEKAATRTDLHEFIPDKLFFNGMLDDSGLKAIVSTKLLPHLAEIRSAQQKQYYENCDYKYDLCPVTRRLVRRYKGEKKASALRGDVKVFISYGGDDVAEAKNVCDFLKNTTEVFFFPDYSHADTLSRTIDDALEKAQCLIVVGTSIENIRRDHCAYEWRRFCQEASGGLKDKAVLPYLLHTVNPGDLPRELKDYDFLQFHPASREKDLERLARKIPSHLRHAFAAGAGGSEQG